MRPARKKDTAPARSLHLGARLEDAFHARHEQRSRRRGDVPTVVPFAGYGSTGWVRVLGRVVLIRARPGGSAPAPRSVRGWRSFTSVPVSDAALTVEIDGTRHEVRADRGGVVDAVVPVTLTPGWHTATLHAQGSERVQAPLFIVGEDARFGVVSDVDDTVMVTAVPRPLLAAWNTFVLNEHARTPTPGMAVLLERLHSQHPGSPMVYLSTGAWNVAPTLTRFLSRNLYPAGAMLLTDWGTTPERWFRSGREHKRENLERLAAEFPRLKWVLIGDDGQHDEQIYGEFARRHPEHVAAVAIRQLTPGEAVLAGGRARGGRPLHGSEVPWIYAPDGAGMAEQLADLGLLAD